MPTPPSRMGRPNQASSPLPVFTGKTYFFGIGINEYSHFSPLRNAVRDVKTIAKLLVDQYGIDQDFTVFLFDKQATRANIINTFEDLSNKVKATDNLIVYYAGHGHTNTRKRGFWIPVEAQKNSIDTYLRNSTIKDYIGDIDSLHTLLISDACFSGTLFVRAQRETELTVRELMKTKSRWAICSGRDDETVADGPAGGHSPFAQSIIDVLSDTERPYIQTHFLISQVIEQTRANYQQVPDGGALSNVGHKRGQYVFRRTLQENAFWKEAKESHSLAAYQNYLHHFPNGKFVQAANENMLLLRIAETKNQLESSPEETTQNIANKLRQLRKAVEEFPAATGFIDYLLNEGQRLEDKRDFLKVYHSEFRLRRFLLRDTTYKSQAQERLEALVKEHSQEKVTAPTSTSYEPSHKETKTTKPLVVKSLDNKWTNRSLLSGETTAYAYVDIRKKYPPSNLKELVVRDRFIRRLQHFAFLDQQARQVIKCPTSTPKTSNVALILGKWAGSAKTGHSLILERLVPLNKLGVSNITTAQNHLLRTESERWEKFFQAEQLSLLGYLGLNTAQEPESPTKKMVGLLSQSFQIFAELKTSNRRLTIYRHHTQSNKQIDWHHSAGIDLDWEAFDQWLTQDPK